MPIAVNIFDLYCMHVHVLYTQNYSYILDCVGCIYMITTIICFQAGYTPLLMACEYQRVATVKCLVEQPVVDLSAFVQEDKHGKTGEKSALHIAAIHDSSEIAKTLINKGCKIDRKDINVRTIYIHVMYILSFVSYMCTRVAYRTTYIMFLWDICALTCPYFPL